MWNYQQNAINEIQNNNDIGEEDNNNPNKKRTGKKMNNVFYCKINYIIINLI